MLFSDDIRGAMVSVDVMVLMGERSVQSEDYVSMQIMNCFLDKTMTACRFRINHAN